MNLEKIVKEGQYYYPAWSRYGPNNTVTCDRCQSRGLISCIGLDQMDLCLECANELAVNMKKEEVFIERTQLLTLMQQLSMRRVNVVTKMMPSMMQNRPPRDQNLTFMEQSSLRP